MSWLTSPPPDDVELLDPTVYSRLQGRLDQMRQQHLLDGEAVRLISDNVKVFAIHTVSTADFIAKLLAVSPHLSPEQQEALQSLADELIALNHALHIKARRGIEQLRTQPLPPPPEPPKKLSPTRQQWESFKQEIGWNELADEVKKLTGGR